MIFEYLLLLKYMCNLFNYKLMSFQILITAMADNWLQHNSEPK